MDIQYIGHSCFRLRGKQGLVITDPFNSEVGFNLPTLRADVVTISHDHADHNNASAIKGTAARNNPFVIDTPGEYEIQGVSVYGYPSYHDDQQGEQRGKNTMFSIFIDDIHVLHLGDLGHILDEKMIEEIPDVDVLLVPVGGIFTINPQQAMEVINMLEPAYVVPMHYKTEQHNQKTFGEMATVDDFMQKAGKEMQTSDKLTISGPRSADVSETKFVILETK